MFAHLSRTTQNPPTWRQFLIALGVWAFAFSWPYIEMATEMIRIWIE